MTNAEDPRRSSPQAPLACRLALGGLMAATAALYWLVVRVLSPELFELALLGAIPSVVVAAAFGAKNGPRLQALLAREPRRGARAGAFLGLRIYLFTGLVAIPAVIAIGELVAPYGGSPGDVIEIFTFAIFVGLLGSGLGLVYFLPTAIPLAMAAGWVYSRLAARAGADEPEAIS